MEVEESLCLHGALRPDCSLGPDLVGLIPEKHLPFYLLLVEHCLFTVHMMCSRECVCEAVTACGRTRGSCLDWAKRRGTQWHSWVGRQMLLSKQKCVPHVYEEKMSIFISNHTPPLLPWASILDTDFRHVNRKNLTAACESILRNSFFFLLWFFARAGPSSWLTFECEKQGCETLLSLIVTSHPLCCSWHIHQSD